MAVAVAVNLSESSEDDMPIKTTTLRPPRATTATVVTVVMNESSDDDRPKQQPIPVHNLRFPIDQYANQYAVCFIFLYYFGIQMTYTLHPSKERLIRMQKIAENNYKMMMIVKPENVAQIIIIIMLQSKKQI